MGKFREIQRLLGKAGEVNFQKWLEYHWNNFTADFNIGMENLDFESNFRSHRATVDISDSGELAIRHELGVVPSAHIVLNGVSGVIRGPTAWTSVNAYVILDSDLYSGKTKTVDLVLLA